VHELRRRDRSSARCACRPPYSLSPPDRVCAALFCTVLFANPARFKTPHAHYVTSTHPLTHTSTTTTTHHPPPTALLPPLLAGLESHGGSTFCALASLQLMGTLDQVLPPRKRARVLHWLISRQMGKGGGFQGRPHKAIDTCYSFWVGSSLHLLGMGGLADAEANRAFLMTTQNSKGGGFAKWPDTMADPLHAYMGISGLALQREPGLAAVHPALNFSRKAAAHVGPPWWRGPAFAAVSVGVIFALRAWRP
jgi:hypothetical protein